MSEERKDGLTETIASATNTAHTIQGAIKTGKAIAGAAKGAAVGGPLGAALGAALGGKKQMVAIAGIAASVFLLPILFVLMLPGLIFGGFTEGFLSSERSTPILNSNEVIIGNINDISFSIHSILAEGIDDVLERINQDFSASDGDGKEIINPHTTNLLYNGNLFVSQYCAAMDADFQSISIANMEQILRTNKSKLYSYSCTSETRASTAIDPESGEEYPVVELWMIYTITYNGEAYFADQVFKLNDMQKSLAQNYAQNLSFFTGDGMYQGLLPSEFTSGASYEGIEFVNGSTVVVYYNQLDDRFANMPYGTDDIGGYGCGPTSMAIVVSSLSNKAVDPIQMAAWAYSNGYWCSKSGSYHALIPEAAKEWGLPVEGCTVKEGQQIVDALASGKLVVALMAKGHFTGSGHFIVLRGVNSDGQILVADPASYHRSEKTWDLSLILNEASRNSAAGGPFWIIG